MREIKFRGKRIDDGGWVDGMLLGDYIVYSYEVDNNYGEETDLYATEFYEVTPETVGQYTGLKDKNGKEIYEGDILHWEMHWGWYVGFENGAFRRIPLNHIQRINWEHYVLQQEDFDTWEVIGNIHENKDLLKEEE